MLSVQLQNLLNQVITGGEVGQKAYEEYKALCYRGSESQVAIDNAFLNYLAEQRDLVHCHSDALRDMAQIYIQKDGYQKPLKFVSYLEAFVNESFPSLHQAYLYLDGFQQKDALKAIFVQSKQLVTMNDPMVQSNLGLMYLKGFGIPEDDMAQKDERAVFWLKKAAKQGYVFAQYYLGQMYRTGRGISEDEMAQKDKQAVFWYKEAAKQGYPFAQYRLGQMYRAGRGISEGKMAQKDELAVFWFKEAAKRGHVRAKNSLGFMYDTGRGISKDEMAQKDELAVFWFKEAAQRGNSRAKNNLGWMYRAGRGIPKEEKKDKEIMAVIWHEEAAMQGSNETSNKAKDALKKLSLDKRQEKIKALMLESNLSYKEASNWVDNFKLRSILLTLDQNEALDSGVSVLPADIRLVIASFLTPLSHRELKELKSKTTGFSFYKARAIQEVDKYLQQWFLSETDKKQAGDFFIEIQNSSNQSELFKIVDEYCRSHPSVKGSSVFGFFRLTPLSEQLKSLHKLLQDKQDNHVVPAKSMDLNRN